MSFTVERFIIAGEYRIPWAAGKNSVFHSWLFAARVSFMLKLAMLPESASM